MFFKDVWVLIFIPILFILLLIRNRCQQRVGFIFSSDEIIKGLKHTLRIFFIKKTYYLKVIALLFILLAMARPLSLGENRIKKEGIAMIIAIDCSSTMLARDLSMDLENMVFFSGKIEDYKNINRLNASLIIAEEFIHKRQDDMIGVVAFAATSFLVCPLTFDHEWIYDSMGRIKVGLIKDGTAIGSGILSSLNSLKDVKAKSRIVILLTDGVNNYGQISPIMAAKTARALGIRIYTIGIAGNSNSVVIPVKDSMGREEEKRVIVELDEDELKRIANISGGEYFRADNIESLRESYAMINRLERTELTEVGYERYTEQYQYYLYVALIMILLEIILSNTIFRTLP